jgi:hypothetical protein
MMKRNLRARKTPKHERTETTTPTSKPKTTNATTDNTMRLNAVSNRSSKVSGASPAAAQAASSSEISDGITAVTISTTGDRSRIKIDYTSDKRHGFANTTIFSKKKKHCSIGTNISIKKTSSGISLAKINMTTAITNNLVMNRIQCHST